MIFPQIVSMTVLEPQCSGTRLVSLWREIIFSNNIIDVQILLLKLHLFYIFFLSFFLNSVKHINRKIIYIYI